MTWFNQPLFITTVTMTVFYILMRFLIGSLGDLWGLARPYLGKAWIWCKISMLVFFLGKRLPFLSLTFKLSAIRT
jgi:hypothetical protein